MFDNSTAKNESKPGAICAFLEDTSAEVNLKAFAYCLIAIGSLLGNSLVILVILKNRKMRRYDRHFPLEKEIPRHPVIKR